MRKDSKTMGVTELTDFGVNVLTGEACAYNLRMLCDLNEDGVELISSWLGITDGKCFTPNWNSYVGEKPAVASIMIARGAFQDLYFWILVHKLKYDVVFERADRTLMGIDSESELYKKYATNEELVKAIFVNTYKFPKNSSESGRNVHQFTGRTE